jgi:RHS repeat-associated protein
MNLASGISNYPHYDQVGSLRAVTDSSGTIIKQIDYDSFGNVINDTNTSMTVPFGFAGGLYDYDTGLVRFGFRDYDPAIGRWTAKDPIDFAGGDVNLFGYVQSDPVNWIDPLGLRINRARNLPESVTSAIRDVQSTPTGRIIYGILDNLQTEYRIQTGPVSQYLDNPFGPDFIYIQLQPRKIEYVNDSGSEYCDDATLHRSISHELGEAFGVSIGLSDELSHQLGIDIENAVGRELGESRQRIR